MNRYLTYQDNQLLFEDVALSEIAEEMYTPFYVYSKAAIYEKVEALKQAFADIKPMLAFSMKALDTMVILKMLLERGCGLEVENINEIQRAQISGFEPTSMIFNSYGIPDREIPAILKKRPLIINVSNIFDLELLNKCAADLNIGVRIGLKINLGIDVGGYFGTNTGAPDSRFGIRREELKLALALIKKYPQLNLVGLATHLGSQVVTLAPWLKMSEEMAKLYKEVAAQDFNLEYLNLGGGFPVEYGKGDFIDIKKIARNVIPHIKDLDCRLILEPGRYFTAEAGVLVTSVLGTREFDNRTAVICDAGFSEFPRPSLYRINHEVVNVHQQEACVEAPSTAFDENNTEPTETGINLEMGQPGIGIASNVPLEPFHAQATYEFDGNPAKTHPTGKPEKVCVVGPGGEGLDYVTNEVEICMPKRGDLLAVLNVGAYGRTFSNNYASRLRPPEVLIERDKFEIIRSRETVEDLVQCEFSESEMDS
jgi:diaminopimelate decarboxylase